MVENDYVIKGHKPYNNFIKIPLRARIDNYGGYLYIASLNKKLTDIQESILYNYLTNIKYTFPTFNEMILKVLLNKQYENKRFCSEFVSEILSLLKIYDFKNVSDVNKHAHIINLCNGNIFSEPMCILSKEKYINDISLYKKNIKNYC